MLYYVALWDWQHLGGVGIHYMGIFLHVHWLLITDQRMNLSGGGLTVPWGGTILITPPGLVAVLPNCQNSARNGAKLWTMKGLHFGSTFFSIIRVNVWKSRAIDKWVLNCLLGPFPKIVTLFRSTTYGKVIIQWIHVWYRIQGCIPAWQIMPHEDMTFIWVEFHGWIMECDVQYNWMWFASTMAVELSRVIKKMGLEYIICDIRHTLLLCMHA